MRDTGAVESALANIAAQHSIAIPVVNACSAGLYVTHPTDESEPSHEVWWLIRKPLTGTLASNVMEWGVGGLNIDGCRVGVSGGTKAVNFGDDAGLIFGGGKGKPINDIASINAGRWPPNTLFTHSASCTDTTCAEDCPVGELARQSGVTSGTGGAFKAGMFGLANEPRGHNDTGTAARFFPTFRYSAKPSRAEREAGCGHLPPRTGAEATGRQEQLGNHHPTVKSIDLMRFLVRLITPPGATVLDPFTGSGTTALACVHEGVSFLGCEREAEYVAIARARVNHADPSGAITRRKGEPIAQPLKGQQSLF